jgi:hypothetical protein
MICAVQAATGACVEAALFVALQLTETAGHQQAAAV